MEKLSSIKARALSRFPTVFRTFHLHKSRGRMNLRDVQTIQIVPVCVNTAEENKQTSDRNIQNLTFLFAQYNVQEPLKVESY